MRPFSADELAALGYNKRQIAYMGVDPDKYKHFKPKLRRKDVGSYADDSVLQEFDAEVSGWGSRGVCL